jgi:hypothetical protein
MKASIPGYLADIPTNGTEIEQGLLDIENKERSNLFAWNGQFSPQFAEVLLRTYAHKNATVLDPFAGSGTVLYECGRGSFHGIAAEINPAAFYMTRTYTFINLTPSARTQCIEKVDRELSRILINSLELWSASQGNVGAEELKRRLIDLRELSCTGWEQVLTDALLVVVNFLRLETVEHVASAWAKLRLIVEGLPYSQQPLRAFNSDARSLPIPNDSVDLVITSPPYINVFNYHQQYRASAEALGWNLLTVAKSEIGSNRKHRANRFLTVVQYCLDITAALLDLNRVCKQSARVIFVVGRESTVRGVRFFNGEIVGRLAATCTSLRVSSRQERSFRNRFGDLIVEDILHFSLMKSSKHSDLFNLADARTLAEDVLKQSLCGVRDSEVASDIHDALENIADVQPSIANVCRGYSETTIRKKLTCHSPLRILIS